MQHGLQQSSSIIGKGVAVAWSVWALGMSKGWNLWLYKVTWTVNICWSNFTSRGCSICRVHWWKLQVRGLHCMSALSSHCSRLLQYVTNWAHLGWLWSLGSQQTPALQQFATAWPGITRGMATNPKGHNPSHRIIASLPMHQCSLGRDQILIPFAYKHSLCHWNFAFYAPPPPPPPSDNGQGIKCYPCPSVRTYLRTSNNVRSLSRILLIIV